MFTAFFSHFFHVVFRCASISCIHVWQWVNNVIKRKTRGAALMNISRSGIMSFVFFLGQIWDGHMFTLQTSTNYYIFMCHYTARLSSNLSWRFLRILLNISLVPLVHFINLWSLLKILPQISLLAPPITLSCSHSPVWKRSQISRSEDLGERSLSL